MSDTIISAIISGLITSIIAIVGIVRSNLAASRTAEQNYQNILAEMKRQSELADVQLQAKIENLQAATSIKIDELTREVREHNGFAQKIPVLEEKANRTDHRLADLERVAKLNPRES